MQMATISRWTLAYFGCALVALVAALALLVSGFGFPSDGLAAPRTLIVVHLLAIGWLTLLMLGALFQFLPVLVGRELAHARLTPLALVLVVSGLLFLLSGFAGLDGWDGFASEMLPVGGLLLISGFGVAAFVLFATLLRAETLPLPAAFVAVALMSVLVTALIGETLAGALAGLVGGEFSVALVTHGVSLHAGFGLGGWLTLAAMGVSYRLVSMFLIAPERKGAWPMLVFGSAFVALAGLCMALGLLLALNTSLPIVLVVAGIAAAVTVVAYLGDIAVLYRARRRKAVELHMLSALGAFGMLALGAVMLGFGLWQGTEAAIGAAVYVLVLGWLSGLGLAMLYKIIPFLTWLECFAPVMGRKPTPRVQDLVAEGRARIWFGVYFAAIVVGALALLAEMPLATRAAMGLQLVSVLFLIGQFYRARRLIDLPSPWQGQERPRLFLPAREPRRFI
ncbi:hypothetical protein [Devosia sp.]|uniref:hypothetical protein n=1 Tax=Devosia sp. TaxID=1871048 RepID=UPI0025E58D43|nr:hypothetical protein [Devosia sp.]MCR6636816.1 hypothetical protein [Devosia sp.]